ncbi:prolyl oligopeptidase family serine peptidase [Stutzerimonas stutzeri]|uniref:Prolyl oligopeptidase family serine peptidase n=1 Tax=Stutzerimonas stutzeri TaxID=316 RepID=A0A6I6LXG0_STUST|nr:prolyl oligopeptidase family serine peptidase [Stutzerimonas stutzeri]QGZ31302.1 prolyl oligopeptidase family serine peptidase [Stutzerimonas stutzeri]
MTQRAIPYGFWPSGWTAEDAASASGDFAELRAGHDGVFWLQYQPEDARCTLWHWRAGHAVCVTPAGVSLRSRVYEYGGGAFCLTDRGVAFVNESDQQIYLQSIDDKAGEPIALTQRGHCRYGDLQFDPREGAIVAIEQSHVGNRVEHRLVSLSVASGQRGVVAEGADFYASPALDADAGRMAWIQWQRPDQPWTATCLWMAERSADGAWQAPRCLAGTGGNESLQQPRFAADGTLYCLSDRAGWWQPWCEQDGRWGPVNHAGHDTGEGAPAAFDHAPAPWQLGTVSYLPLASGGLLLTRTVEGHGLLLDQDREGRERPLATAFTRCRQLAADPLNYYCIAGAVDRAPAVLAIARATGRTEIIAGGQQPLPADQLSRPEPFSFTTAGSETAHAFFYPPRNLDCMGLGGEKPPLVVFLHGGPTSACYPVFDPRIQYWTQRGFAVADLNYRGSSGFGRAYRQRLYQQWGVVDVEDAGAVVSALAERGQIDPRRTFIRGSSAGGYTALCALASDAGFSGGASLYGVSDPLALRRVTHKFEADYLDWLIGDPERDAERYRQRTPLLNAARIRVPVIFFQGGQDAVVLPEQTESMVAALGRRNVPVEYCFYPQERHGFRQAANLADALERECRFYLTLLH